jgi:uncharacterized heparinase superfamily protein
VLLLALIVAMAISVVRGNESAQDQASEAIRRELRRRVHPGGGNSSSANPSALLGGSSLALVLGISGLVAGALFQDI